MTQIPSGNSDGGLLVSVVMPSFNQAVFLREALDSILDQDYPNVEILVVDGGSTDGSVAILESYGDRISFTSEKDGGQSDAINKGFARARGEVVAWLNSDDRYCVQAISRAVEGLLSDPHATMLYGEAELIDVDGAFLTRFQATQAFDLWKLIHVSDFIMQPTVFMRREFVMAVGGLDEDLNFGMDWDLWIRLACLGPVVYLRAVLAQTREYAETKTSTGGWQRLRELKKIMARHGAPGWSPGTIAYGLDTLRKQCPILFGPSSAADVERYRKHPLARLFGPFHWIVIRMIDKQISHAQGVYPGGLLGRLAYLAVARGPESTCVTLRGELPQDMSLPCDIEMRSGLAVIRAQLTRAGEFELELRLPSSDRPDRHAVDLELRCSRTVWRPEKKLRLAFELLGVSACADTD